MKITTDIKSEHGSETTFKGKLRIGIDLGGTNIKAGVVDADNNLLFSHKIKTGPTRQWQEIVEDMANAVREVAKMAEMDLSELCCIGLGSPGAVDAKRGSVLFFGNIDNWEMLPIGDALGELLSLRVHMANDADCAALGEYLAGAAKGHKSALVLTLGTGVGGAFVANGKLFAGGGVGAMELGHIQIVENGEYCTCGKNGCAEAYVSGTALIRETKAAAKLHPNSLINTLYSEEGKISARTAFEAAKAGDEVGRKIVEDYIKRLSDTIVSLVNIFRPEVVILSGGISGEGEYLTAPINDYLKKYAFASRQISPPSVITAKLGNDAGMVGAANL